jgi:hypothetical protein
MPFLQPGSLGAKRYDYRRCRSIPHLGRIQVQDGDAGNGLRHGTTTPDRGSQEAAGRRKTPGPCLSIKPSQTPWVLGSGSLARVETLVERQASLVTTLTGRTPFPFLGIPTTGKVVGWREAALTTEPNEAVKLRAEHLFPPLNDKAAGDPQILVPVQHVTYRVGRFRTRGDGARPGVSNLV